MTVRRLWKQGGDAAWTYEESEFIQDLIFASARHTIDFDGIIEAYFNRFRDVGRSLKSLKRHVLAEHELLRKEIFGNG